MAGCDHYHRTRYPEDPPLPEGLSDAVTAYLTARRDGDESEARRKLWDVVATIAGRNVLRSAS